MSETAKTLMFLAAAAIAVALTFIWKPAGIPREALDDSGQPFYESFDPLTARSLEITRFDERSSAPTVFKVAQVNDLWSLPSAENYPADAEKQLALAATSIMDVVKGSRVSDRATDHELYGVLDPSTTAAGGSGVGVKVRLGDGQGKTLAEYIIGKTVKDAPEQRFVRVPGRDAVYTAKISTDKLSTTFTDWIEKDLLKIDVANIANILIDAYSIDEVQGTLQPDEVIELAWDSKTRQWSLKEIPEGRTLNTVRIEELRSSLEDLKIVDVRRKPAGLSSELKAQEQMQLDIAAVESLQSKGFFIAQGMLLSNEGEMHVNLDTGVRYILRFGEVVSGESSEVGALNRYLFITAQFDEALIPPVQLTPLPELPAAATAPTTQSAEATQPEVDGAPSTAPATAPATAPVDDRLREVMAQAREQVQVENDAKLAQRARAIEEGRKRVQQLNNRFADWYYIISDSVYTRLKVTREELLAPEGGPEEPAAEGGVGEPGSQDEGAPFP